MNEPPTESTIKRPLGLLALCLAGACATHGVHPKLDLESRIVVTDIDRLVARSLLEPIDSGIFISVAQRDSMATALASLRAADSMLNADLSWSGAAWMESVQIWVHQRKGVVDSTFNRRLGACAGAVQDTFDSDRGGVGFAQRSLPRGCWPALDTALTILPDAAVSIAHWSSFDFMSVEVSTNAPVNARALASYLAARLGRFAVPNGLLNPWPPIGFERVAKGWQFTLVRGYGDCPGDCIHRRYFPFLYVPSTGEVKKLPERGDPWPPPPEHR